MLDGPVGINEGIFSALSFIYMILVIFIKFKYKYHERNVSFGFIIFLMMVMSVSAPIGGLELEGKQYFDWQVGAYLDILPLIIIQTNLCINFISQGNIFQKKDDSKEKVLEKKEKVNG